MCDSNISIDQLTPLQVIGTGMDGWSSKLIGCRRLLTRGLSKAKGAMRTGLQCVLLQYNWDVMIGRALLRGLQPSASLLELKRIDKGRTIPRDIKSSSLADATY